MGKDFEGKPSDRTIVIVNRPEQVAQPVLVEDCGVVPRLVRD
jgi:hypothetical protein